MSDKSNNPERADDFAEFEDGNIAYSVAGPKRKSGPKKDPLKDILETLYSEHRYISSLLDTLEREALRLKPGKIPDYHLMLDIVDYLTHYPDQYHHPREDMLFSGMLDSDSSFQSELDRLLREHETLHHYNHELLAQLTAIADGRPVNRPELMGSITRYIAGYRQHVEYENKEIFPRAKGKLRASDLKKLSAKTRYLDDPLFGGEVQYRYQRLGRNMQTRMELASAEIIAREMTGLQSLIENLTTVVDKVSHVRVAVRDQHREAWREQIDTFREHVRPGQEPGIMQLPGALIRNHRRHVSDGYSELKEILDSGQQDRKASTKKPVKKSKPRKRSAGG